MLTGDYCFVRGVTRSWSDRVITPLFKGPYSNLVFGISLGRYRGSEDIYGRRVGTHHDISNVRMHVIKYCRLGNFEASRRERRKKEHS